jgi:hypothetical protein
MPSICKHPECKKNASYNFKDIKLPKFCKEHKEEGMVINKVDSRICTHEDHKDEKKVTRASFNFPNQLKPIFCNKHKLDGMINLNSKNNKCIKCNKISPSYGYSNKNPTHCSKCAEEDMVDLVSNLCSYNNCRINATFGYLGLKPSRCKKHKEEDMIDVKNKKCTLCNKQPTFGFNNNATHCLEHKTAEMKDCKHINVLCQICDIRATYGYEKPTHCVKHKFIDMKDVVSDMCKKCGKIQPIFGYTKDNLFCESCKEKDMKDVVHKMCMKCNEHQPTYNYKNVKPAIYCKGCALDNMVDVVNPKCKSCGLFMVCKKPHLCSYCKPTSSQKQRTKEMLVVNFLKENGYEFIHNKSVGYVCGNYRPDIKIDCGTHIVIIEVDENQHESYEKSCENVRMFNIAQAEGLKCTFLRYNPDSFRLSNKVKIVHTNTRLKILKEQIDKEINNIPNEVVRIIKLFYDNNENLLVFEEKSSITI